MKFDKLTEAYLKVTEAEMSAPQSNITGAYFTLPGLIKALQSVNNNSSFNDIATALAQHIGAKSAQRFVEFLKTEYKHGLTPETKYNDKHTDILDTL